MQFISFITRPENHITTEKNMKTACLSTGARDSIAQNLINCRQKSRENHSVQCEFFSGIDKQA